MKTKYDIHGALYFNPAGKLVDHNGKVIHLRGFSTHDLCRYPKYINRPFFEFMRDKWHIDVIRLTIYTDGENGYCMGNDLHKKDLIQLIDKGVKAATELGLYVIINWHILSDSNPLMHMDEAGDFFRKIAKRYRAYGNVIYEICHETDGNCSWEDMKQYAGTIIPIIREYDPYGIILVGTPNRSQDVDLAYQNPVSGYSNIGYTLHFYANSHRDDLRNKLTDAVNHKLPLFVSAFSICDACDDGECNEDQGKLWLDLMDEHKISYCMWNLSNCDKSSAAFIPTCEKTTDFTKEDLTLSAKWYLNELAKRN